MDLIENKVLHDAGERALEIRARSARTKAYYWDAGLWAKDMLDIDLWSKQREIVADLATHKNIAVKAGHSVGKSLLSAVLICWWVDTRYPNVFVASTAPSVAQIGAVIWREIRRLYTTMERRYKAGIIDHKLPGTINTDNRNNEWKDANGAILGFGRKPPEESVSDAFQGIHDAAVLAIGDEACHDADTDVLTARGWVNWTQVREDDLFLSWDTEAGTTEYLLAERLIAYEYSGPMYHYKNLETDFMVTPNHTMLYETAVKPGTIRRDEVQDITFSNKFMFRNIPAWEGEDIDEFVVSAWQGKRKFYPEQRFDAVDWAQFIGWVGSEGSLSKQGYDVRIWQCKEHYRDEIRDLLTRMGLKFTEYSDFFQIHSGRLAKFLMESGRTTLDKRVPEYVRLWSKRLIEEYLTAYAKGDGYAKDAGRVIYTSGTQMANDLQELALKCGYGSTITERPPVTGQPLADGRRITSTRTGYVVSMMGTNRRIRLRHEYVAIEDYSGMVYCATLPKNNTLFTRRNGKTLWSGNCGLSMEMIDALGNITTNESSRRLLIANPTNPASYFGKLFKEKVSSWRFHTISVYDSPNFTDEKYELKEDVLEKLVGPTYVNDKKAEYGENSARFKARVLGEFAFDLGDTLIQPDDLIVADDCELIPSTETTPRLGVDIAAMGVDKSVIYSYHDGQLRFVTSWDKADAVESARRIIETANGLGCKEVRIDAGGFGGAVADIVLNDEQCLFTVVKMWGSKPSPDKHQWFNARAFWWDRFRSLCRQDKMDIDPLDETLHDELMSVEYKTNTSTSGIQIESKDDMRKRGFKSPDYADAAIYAAAELDEVLNDPLATRVGEKVYEDMEQFEIGWMNILPW